MSATMRRTMVDALAAALETDPNVVVLGEMVGALGGVSGGTEGLRERFGAERVRDLPVAERGMVGLALGLALAGRRVVVELTSASRALAVTELLAEAAAIAATGEFPVHLVVRLPVGDEAGPRLDRPVTALLASVAGLSVISPSSAVQAGTLLTAALAAGRPVVILEPRALLEHRGGEAGVGLAARTVRDGRHLTLASWGAGVDVAVEAAEVLAAEGVEAAVIDLVSLAPLDAATLGASVRATGRLVVLEPPGSDLAAQVLCVGLGEAFLYLESPPVAARASTEAALAAARDAVHF